VKVLPVLIFALVALPLLVLAFLARRRSTRAGEQPAGVTDEERALEDETFAEAERYQAEWREEQHRREDERDHTHDAPLP
jgi:hypothetical protein